VLSVAFVGATGITVAGCGLGPTTEVPPPPAPAVVEAVAPRVEVRGACLDSTDSMPRALVDGAVEALASLVEGWAPRESNYMAGARPWPGLDLSVRKVLGESSLVAEGELVHVSIPGVPGVMAKPLATDPNFITASAAWRMQAGAATAAAATARAETARFSEAIRTADWSSTSSEISGCVVALGLTQRGPDARYLVVSDLDQTDPPQTAIGKLGGAEILVVHACADAEVCAAQQADWRRTIADLGGGPVDFSRPERLDQDVPGWLGPRGEP
jgi:hypothetical protein